MESVILRKWLMFRNSGTPKNPYKEEPVPAKLPVTLICRDAVLKFCVV